MRDILAACISTINSGRKTWLYKPFYMYLVFYMHLLTAHKIAPENGEPGFMVRVNR